MTEYILLNPCINCDPAKTKTIAKDDNDAANKIWQLLSSYMANYVPKFAFTIKNMKGGTLHSYSVSESETKSDNPDKSNITYTLTAIDVPADKHAILLNRVTTVCDGVTANSENKSDSKQTGGKSKRYKKEGTDDSDDSDDSDDEKKLKKLYKKAKKYNFINNTQPVYYWWYDPVVYNFDYLYIPTFTYPMSPYVHINLLN